MNDKLYNDLLEYCNYNLEELEKTLNYFMEKLKNEKETKEME